MTIGLREWVKAGRRGFILPNIFRKIFSQLFPEDKPATTLTDGSPVTDDHREIDLATGMQKGYVVLSDEERAKGFVRPVRRNYVHIGPPGPDNLRELTVEEMLECAKYGYVRWEQYPEERSPVVGRYWTQTQLDVVKKGGCKSVTTMGQALAETYARDPSFYGGTFCAGCGSHFLVGQGGEFVWDGTDERVGT